MERTINPNTLQTLLQGFAQLYPDEVAEQLETMPPPEASAVLRQFTPPHAAAVLTRLNPDLATRVLAGAEQEWLRAVVPELNYDRAAALLARFDPPKREEILGSLRRSHAAELTQMMQYPPETAGSLMDPRVTAFRPEATVEQVLQRLRELGQRRVINVYLIDGDGYLKGAVALQHLALGHADQVIENLPRVPSISISATATREEVVETLEDHKMPSLPVVDFEGRLVGVIRYDALIDAAEDEVTADLQTMVGAGREERALSPAPFAVRKRLPWLQINLATAFLAASVVGIFEETIARVTALAVLLPVVAGQSGNTGAQALAVTMRGLALREITLSQWIRVTAKEATVGLLNGLAVAIVTVAAVFIWSGSAGLCLVIGLAMVMAMVIAGIAGALIPLLLSAVGQDPAQSSSIILTTVTDVFGFFSFLGLAALFSAML